MPNVHTVEISGFAFVPEDLVIERGDKVKWVNRDGSRHDAIRDDAPAFATGLLNQGQESSEIEFPDASSKDGFSYYCTPHQSFMKGRIIVVLPGSNGATFSRSAAIRAHATSASKEESSE